MCSGITVALNVPCFEYPLNCCDVSAGLSSEGTKVLHAFVQAMPRLNASLRALNRRSMASNRH
jgi:hypothetical protein